MGWKIPDKITVDPQDNNEVPFDQGGIVRKSTWLKIKNYILGTATLTTTDKTMRGSVNEINASLSEMMKQNILINGDFRINQRVVSGTVTLSANTYGHDRWKAGASGCTYTFATSDGKTTITITAGSLIQVVEGINLTTGTYVLSWGGTATGKIGSGAYSSSGITSSVTGGTNLNIEFGIGTLFNAKLEKGTVVTPFISRIYGEEEILCKRYCQSFVAIGVAYNASLISIGTSFPIAMRSTPTCIIGGNVSGINGSIVQYGSGATINMSSYSTNVNYRYLDNLVCTDAFAANSFYRISCILDAEL